MDRNYTKRYCACEEWGKIDRGSEYGREKLYALLKHYPNVCPYCHKKLKTRPCKIEVFVNVEHELGRPNPFSDGYPIPLEDLKKLLGDV